MATFGLEQDLREARDTIVHLAPPPYDEILESYIGEREGFVKYARDWLEQAVEKILEHFEPQVIGKPVQQPCPLCRGTPDNPRSIGFIFPEGLRRHLLGTYNARMCRVTRAAKALCHEVIHQFDGWDQRGPPLGKAAVDPGVVHWDKVKE